jgi:hypothetical protein
VNPSVSSLLCNFLYLCLRFICPTHHETMLTSKLIITRVDGSLIRLTHDEIKFIKMRKLNWSEMRKKIKQELHGNAIYSVVLNCMWLRRTTRCNLKRNRSYGCKKKPFRQLLVYHRIKIYAGKCEFVTQYKVMCHRHPHDLWCELESRIFFCSCYAIKKLFVGEPCYIFFSLGLFKFTRQLRVFKVDWFIRLFSMVLLCQCCWISILRLWGNLVWRL